MTQTFTTVRFAPLALRPEMTKTSITARGTLPALLALALLGVPAVALAAPDSETAYVLNSFAFLIWGALVMFMCAGFTMLEAGSVRTKNASVICLKNIGLYAIAGIAYYLVGYNIMYLGVDGGWFGSLALFRNTTPEEVALLAGEVDAAAIVAAGGHANMSDWFFQMVFVATTASIVSGTIAERIKLWSFFLFVALLTAVIYPVVGAWTWGGGWLNELGFSDFAGSTIVHSTGGWAALVGAYMLGSRKGKFRADGTVRQTPPSNVPMVTLGVFILWFGWFGFNGGSQLSLSSVEDVVAIANILANTNLAAAGGVIAAIAVSRPILGRVDLLASLNGAIAGLVAITAGPDMSDHQWAILIGAVGGVISVVGTRLLELIKIDDVVGAVPAHLFSGIWGTLAVALIGEGDVLVQLMGIGAVGVFVCVASVIVWGLVKLFMGLRVSPQVETLGQDVSELKIEAYPEFMVVPDPEE